MDGLLEYCSLLLVISLIVSIIITKIRIEKTGKKTVQMYDGILINILAGIVAIAIWLYYTENEFATVIGTLFLLGCTIVSLIILGFYHFILRNKMIKNKSNKKRNFENR